jgi:RNA polymerase sigma factor (sigma-70 family)
MGWYRFLRFMSTVYRILRGQGNFFICVPFKEVGRKKMHNVEEATMDFWPMIERTHGQLRGLFLKWCNGDADKASGIFEFACRQAHRLYASKDEASLKRLLCKIAKNHLRDLFEQERRAPKQFLGVDLQSIPDKRSSRSLEDQDFHLRLEEELARLPPQWSAVLQRLWFENQTYERIAHDFGTPVGTVKSQSYRARKRLQVSLAEFRPR